MKKTILISTLLGGLVAFIWLTVSNAVIPVKSDMIHRIAPNQLEVHAALKDNITTPGTYAIPYLSRAQESSLPEYRDQPVYTVMYTGYTHGDQGSSADFFVPLAVVFLVAFLASWMLSVTSGEVLSRYGMRVLFVTLLGVVIALHDDILQMYLGPQPRDYLVFLAVSNVLTWFLMGLVIAWRIKPKAA